MSEASVYPANAAAVGPLRSGTRLPGRQSSLVPVHVSPSDACRRAGRDGWNVAIFRESVVAPSRIRILGRSGDVLEALP